MKKKKVSQKEERGIIAEFTRAYNAWKKRKKIVVNYGTNNNDHTTRIHRVATAASPLETDNIALDHESWINIPL